jgi:SHS2 domain-containing protein
MKKTQNNGNSLYRELEHTGDLGIEIVAPTRLELFHRATLALADLLVDPSNVAGATTYTVELTGDDDIDLMHDLLTELLQLFAAEGFIWRDATIEERGRTLRAILEGESFNPNRHSSRGEIKAVTYHQLAVEKELNQWRARIIFDI